MTQQGGASPRTPQRTPPPPAPPSPGRQVPRASQLQRPRLTAARLAALAASALLGLAITAAGAPSSFSMGPTELTPSVMVVGMFDWAPFQPSPPYYSSRCTQMIERVAELGGSLVNYVPTHYWRGGPGQPVAEYCYMDSGQVCKTFDAAAVDSFRSGMELCFRKAISAGLGFSLVPHLDDAGDSSEWRNGLVFSPKQQYGGMSYQQVMLDPLAEALAAAIAGAGRPVPVRFALQGEMSATVLRFPREYAQLIDEMKGKLLAAMWARGASGAEVDAQRAVTKVGTSFNFNRLMSTNPVEEEGGGGGLLSSNIVGLLGGGNNIRVPGGAGGGLQRLLGRGLRQAGGGAEAGVDKDAIRQLFETQDFLGVSAYAPLSATFQPQDLQSSMVTFYREMRWGAGVDVEPIIARRNREARNATRGGGGPASPAVELHYSEFGLGGGSFSGVAPALSPSAATRSPYFGMPSTYRLVTDPWANPLMREFMHSFYSRSLAWLAEGGGPSIHVSHCFQWGMGSWDVLGIYPESTTREGSYRDGEVVDMVREHNRKAVLAAAQRQPPLPQSGPQPQTQSGPQPQPPVAK